MRYRAYFLLALIALALVGPPQVSANSHPMDRITAVRQSVQSNTLRLVLETEKAPPVASVFFLTGPERLVIELNDALPAAQLGAKPATPMVKEWGLKPSSLHRSQLVLTLDHRPPTSEVKVQVLTGPHRVVVDVPVDPYVKEEMALTKGITWIREDRYLAGLWVRLNRLLFDPRDPNISVELGLAQEKVTAREKVSSMVARTGAVAGLNGGFFASQGGALGLVYRDGKLLAPHVQRRPPRSGFGLTQEGRPLFGRLASTGPSFRDLEGGDWSAARWALGGGPRLLKDGAPRITAKEEELGPGGNDITRVAGRSLVGALGDGRLLFSTVSGFRDNHSQGSKFEPLVDWLLSLGVRDAVNFDGGASVNMVIGEHIVSDGPGCVTGEKPVATALLLLDRRERLYPAAATWNLSQTALPADGQSSVEASLRLTKPDGGLVPDGTLVRLFGHGVTVQPAQARTQGGQVTFRLTSVRRPGAARVTATCGPLTTRRELTLQGGEASRIQVQLLGRRKEKVGSQEVLRVQAKVGLTDRWGNPVAQDGFTVELDGSAPYRFQSDERGLAVLELDTALTGGQLTVRHPKAPAVVLPVGPIP